MTNQALPQQSRQMLENYLDGCQNLGLILDKFAPWGQDRRGGWDLTMRSTIRRRGESRIQTLTGGEAKGLWLSTSRRALNGESPSLFEVGRTDVELMREHYRRWENMIRDSEGVAFTMTTAERLVAGLGASHVLETGLTLERNTGLPYLPGSTVKGLARAWGLIEVAAQLDISLGDTVMGDRGEADPGKESKELLNVLAEILISEPDEELLQQLQNLRPVSEDAIAYIEWFRFIFGSQGAAGAVCFADAVYAGEQAPQYAADVMTPHYVAYYTNSGGSPPAEDDNPNPVSFIAVERGNTFAFGLMPRQSAFDVYESAADSAEKRNTALDVAVDWLVKGLSQLGVGSKTAAGYGFFRGKSRKYVVGR